MAPSGNDLLITFLTNPAQHEYVTVSMPRAGFGETPHHGFTIGHALLLGLLGIALVVLLIISPFLPI